MAGMKLFIWNDDDETLQTWKDAAISDGIDQDDIATCHSKNADTVVREWAASDADVVLLDIMLNATVPFGLSVAKRIRDVDQLVPIVAATAYPDQVYNAYIDEAGSQHARLAGIYHISALKKGLFVDFALRESLQRWHMSCKQFALLRRCVQSLQREKPGPACGGSAKGLLVLADSLSQLAFERSVDVWHEHLSLKIEQLLRDAELQFLATSFAGVASLFRKADKYHMAVGRGRRHLAHNVQVFAAGLPCLLADGELRRHAEESIKNLFPDRAKGDRAYLAVLLWACASMTHDVAYIGETFGDACRELSVVAKEMDLRDAPVGLGGGSTIMSVAKKGDSHAAIGGHVWRCRFADSCSGSKVGPGSGEKESAEIVALAIESHHGSVGASAKIVAKEWMSFLASMCDEIQDWHRERHDEEVLWEYFELERFGIASDTKGTNIDLDFVAQDIPLVAAWIKGLPSRATVEARLNHIKQQMESRLDCGGKMHIRMRAHFPLRRTHPAESNATF